MSTTYFHVVFLTVSLWSECFGRKQWNGISRNDAKYHTVSLLLSGLSSETVKSVQEFCPEKFKLLRRQSGIQRSTHRLGRSCPENCVQPLTGGGSRGAARRGTLFLLSRDGRIILKEESFQAIQKLLSILDEYQLHLAQGPSLLPRFIGAYRVYDGKTVTHWLLMKNVLNDVPTTTTFDLKGSRAGRRAKSDASTLKDLDAIDQKNNLLLQKKQSRILNVLRRDTMFLQKHTLLDYSLLVGLVDKRTILRPWRPRRFFLLWRLRSPATRLARQRGVVALSCANHKSCVFMGLIDILQPWTTAKLFEFCARGSIYGYDQISAVPPSSYRERFLMFTEKLISERC